MFKYKIIIKYLNQNLLNKNMVENKINIERSNLWQKIFNIVKKLRLEKSEGDCVDHPTSTTEIEKLVKDNMLDLLKSFNNDMSKKHHWYMPIPEESEIIEYLNFYLNKNNSKSLYEYELYFNDDSQFCSIHGWYPIATDRIKNPEKIDEYIKSGILRKITK